MVCLAMVSGVTGSCLIEVGGFIKMRRESQVRIPSAEIRSWSRVVRTMPPARKRALSTQVKIHVWVSKNSRNSQLGIAKLPSQATDKSTLNNPIHQPLLVINSVLPLASVVTGSILIKTGGLFKTRKKSQLHIPSDRQSKPWLLIGACDT